LGLHRRRRADRWRQPDLHKTVLADVEQRIWIAAKRGIGWRPVEPVKTDGTRQQQVSASAERAAIGHRGYKVRPGDGDGRGDAHYAAIAADAVADADGQRVTDRIVGHLHPADHARHGWHQAKQPVVDVAILPGEIRSGEGTADGVIDPA
jgi:hypothetical protein